MSGEVAASELHAGDLILRHGVVVELSETQRGDEVKLSGWTYHEARGYETVHATYEPDTPVWRIKCPAEDLGLLRNRSGVTSDHPTLRS